MTAKQRAIFLKLAELWAAAAQRGAERTALCPIVLGVLLREPPLAPRTWEALAFAVAGPFHQELNSPSSADLVAPLGAHLAKPEGRWVLVGSPARALSSSRYRISRASIFQSHKTASNTASGGPSHHAKSRAMAAADSITDLAELCGLE